MATVVSSRATTGVGSEACVLIDDSKKQPNIAANPDRMIFEISPLMRVVMIISPLFDGVVSHACTVKLKNCLPRADSGQQGVLVSAVKSGSSGKAYFVTIGAFN